MPGRMEIVSLVPTLLVLSVATAAAQTLETESARLLPAHGWKIGNAIEFQKSSEGTEAAVPVMIEYGLTSPARAAGRARPLHRYPAQPRP